MREYTKRMKNERRSPGRHNSVDLEMSRGECTGVPHETVQQNDGK